MAEKTLAQKLLLKPGTRAAVVNPPAGYLDALQAPNDLTISSDLSGQFDFVQVFVASKADVDRYAADALRAVKPNGLLWFAFPKQSSKMKTDINRDKGWDAVYGAGWQGIANVAIDGTWSALRFVNRNK